MKKLLALSLTLAICLSLYAVPTYAADTAAPPASGSAGVTAAPVTDLPQEYAVVKQTVEGGSDFRLFTNAADVRRIKALLPDYAGGQMVDAPLTGTPIKVRYASGTNAYAYEVYPNDLIVWWYDMKCATVKGAYSAVTTLMKNAPQPVATPRFELREYGAGDYFVHYTFLEEPSVASQLAEYLRSATPVDALAGPLPTGGIIVSATVINGLSSDSYYIYSYGYAQNQSTNQLYRLKPGVVDLFWGATGLFATLPEQYALISYWPDTVELEKTRVYYTRQHIASLAEPSDSTAAQIAFEQITSVLGKDRKPYTDNDAISLPDTTPIVVTLVKNGQVEQYSLYEDGLLLKAYGGLYTLPESAYQTLLSYYKS